MPACFVVVGDTVEEARSQARQARQPGQLRQRDCLALDRARHRRLEVRSGQPAARDIPESNACKSGRERAIASAKRDNLTVRQLAQRLGGYSAASPWSARPKTIADEMEEWLDDQGLATASPSFPVSARRRSTISPRASMPELQRRGLFRREYEGKTLRENLGLPRPGTASSTHQGRGGRIDMTRDREFPRPRLLRRADRAQAQQLCEAAGQEIRRQGRADARQPGRPASARKLPAHHRQGSIHRGDLLAGAQPSGLTVFTHAQTGNALKDHTDHVIWLGPSETLELYAVPLALL